MAAHVLDGLAVLCALDAAFVAWLAGSRRESVVMSSGLGACCLACLAGARLAS